MSQLRGSTSSTFHNGDACGDKILMVGNGNIFQLINSISNIFHVIVGISTIYNAKSSNIQQSGLCLIITAIFSFVYHSTSKSSGFILDILGMIIWGISLVYNGLCLLNLANLKCKILSSMIGVYIIIFIHYLMEFNYSPIYVWYIWALHFAILMTIASLIPIYIGFKNKMLNMHYIKRIIIAILTISFGFVWTQLIHIFCDQNTLTINIFFPFHSLWHLFAAIAAYLMMSLLDDVNLVIKRNNYKKNDSILIV